MSKASISCHTEIPTVPSVMDKMKVVCQQKSSVSTMQVVDRDLGDIVGQLSSGSHLRNLHQITIARRTLKLETGSKGQLFETMKNV